MSPQQEALMRRLGIGAIITIIIVGAVLFFKTPSSGKISDLTGKVDSLTVQVGDLSNFAYGELIDTLIVIRKNAIEANAGVKANAGMLGRIDRRIADMHSGLQRSNEYVAEETEEVELKDRRGDKYRTERFTSRAMQARAYLNRK